MSATMLWSRAVVSAKFSATIGEIAHLARVTLDEPSLEAREVGDRVRSGNSDKLETAFATDRLDRFTQPLELLKRKDPVAKNVPVALIGGAFRLVEAHGLTLGRHDAGYNRHVGVAALRRCAKASMNALAAA